MEFIYALLNILNGMSPYILLGFLIAGLLHVFVKLATMSRHLAGSGLKPVVKAALLGIPLPLCSCGVLPAAISLRRNGASAAASTSFLIATPQTGVDSIAATYSLLGPFMAVVRPVAALVGSVFGGMVVGRFSDDSKPMEEDSEECCCSDGCCSSEHNEDNRPDTLVGKIAASLRYGFVDMIQHVGRWLVIGLIIGALITVFVPDNLLVELSRYPLLAMLLMVAVAVPMYVCATGSIPIALSLMLKGLSPGVAFVLLMAGPAANFASVMVLRRSMGTRATACYIISVVLTAIVFGLAIDLLVPSAWTSLPSMHGMHSHGHFSVFDTLCSLLLVGLLINAYLQRRFSSRSHHHHNSEMKRTYKITGMMCPHCEANVRGGLEAMCGVESVSVSLSSATAVVVGTAAPTQVIAKISSLGYDASEITAEVNP